MACVRLGLILSILVCKTRKNAKSATGAIVLAGFCSPGVRLELSRVALVLENKSCLAYETVLVYKLYKLHL